MTSHFAETALLPDGWADRVRFEIDARGDLLSVTADADPAGAERLDGPVVPGMPNLHSHAFQRAMAGLAERVGAGEDSFWGWREVMYRFLGALTPEDVQAIAAWLYVEMLKVGYTAVGEFHYLHHAADGTPYADRAELSERIIAAATETGIGLTHLPVLYQTGGFGGVPPGAGQRRFLNGVDDILGLVEDLARRHGADPQFRLGVAPHSLRAVPPASLDALVAGLRDRDPTAPIHIHVAEQIREVDDCVAWSGARPVEWLLDHAPVDRHWCLVHATHVEATEIAGMAAAQAVVGLCPTTEANLGDGLFPVDAYQAASGRWGIGSDSHISVSPIEELRWLDYGQRLIRRRRWSAGQGEGSIGTALYGAALSGGAAALGRLIGRLAPGYRADLLVLDADHPTLLGRRRDTLLDALVFAGNGNPVRHVMVGGRWRVRDGRHPAEREMAERFRLALARIG
ncbi:MAG TPA: formimidoylglutamate deiminase [Stellaceae bacterium]|nr:formimidoylglutamate deiminase [Stellaceae bacterium]